MRRRLPPGRRIQYAAVAIEVVLYAASVLAGQRTLPEYTAKAGFLTAFARYVSWPSHDVETPESAIVLCVIGRDPFGEVLDRTVAATLGTPPLAVRRIGSASEAAGCHIAFIGRGEGRREAEWLTALGRQSVLTVGESGQSVKRGGVLEFAFAGDRVIFDVNLPAALEAGIKLSADLMAHARRVYR